MFEEWREGQPDHFPPPSVEIERGADADRGIREPFATSTHAHTSDASGGPADTLEGVNGQEEEQGRGHADAP